MTIETTPFDAAKYLDTPEAQAELINDALETGDGAYIAHALNTVARARGMSQIAKDAGITREGLYKALGPSGDPKFTTILGVMKALGLQISARVALPPAHPELATARRRD